MALSQTPPASSPVTEMRYAVLPERMPGIPPETMSAAQREAVAKVVASRGALKGAFVALVRSPQLMDCIQKLGAQVRFHSAVDLRINRVASLMTTRHWSNQYEWSSNTAYALKAGLKPHIVEAIGEGRRPTGMAEDEEIVYDFMSELLANKSISDATYQRAVAKFGEPGVIDLLGIVGYYAMLAMIINVVRTPLPDGKPLPLVPMPQQLRPNI